jgi:hypothetical protein
MIKLFNGRVLAMVAAVALATLGVAACSEEPQRLASARKPGFETDAWQDQLRERTLNQSELNRIYR